MSTEDYYFGITEHKKESEIKNEDFKKDFNIIVKKLLETKPELQEWVEKNFSQYLKGDN